MLSFQQIKEIENALGADKAGPVILAFESLDERMKAELVSREHFDMKIAALETRIAESKAEIIKWVVGLLLAQTGIIAALVKLL